MPLRALFGPTRDEYFALCTYRRNGTGVVTPVWMAPAEDRWYVYTPGRSGKVRRIRRNPAVSVASSDFSGRPRSPWQSGHARVLEGRESRLAWRALAAKYPLKFRIAWLLMILSQTRKRGGPPVGLEIVFADPELGALHR